ncbi:MAG: nuclear transport factor 2 family protein [Candidatus Sulfotelmatobacter sp.]|jgi:hypothetical protein
MKAIFTPVAFLLLLTAAATAQEMQHPAGKTSSGMPAVEAKVRKVWEDFKDKNKTGLGAALAEGFREMEEGGSGFGDKKAELAMVDDFELTSYVLRDFALKSLGAHSALVTYSAHYEGKSGGLLAKSDSIFGEVWVYEGGDWKVLYIQETAVK